MSRAMKALFLWDDPAVSEEILRNSAEYSPRLVGLARLQHANIARRLDELEAEAKARIAERKARMGLT